MDKSLKTWQNGIFIVDCYTLISMYIKKKKSLIFLLYHLCTYDLIKYLLRSFTFYSMRFAFRFVTFYPLSLSLSESRITAPLVERVAHCFIVRRLYLLNMPRVGVFFYVLFWWVGAACVRALKIKAIRWTEGGYMARRPGTF